MSSPTPRAHLVRLVALLILGFIGFLGVRAFMVPDHWSYDEWYRKGALVDLKNLPVKYGGNESCVACHKDEHEEFSESTHKGLSCESCHGPVASHVKGEKKIADAQVIDSREVCLNCHVELMSRPRSFKQVSRKRIEKENAEQLAAMPSHREEPHKKISKDKPCSKCHDYHDPEP